MIEKTPLVRLLLLLCLPASLSLAGVACSDDGGAKAADGGTKAASTDAGPGTTNMGADGSVKSDGSTPSDVRDGSGAQAAVDSGKPSDDAMVRNAGDSALPAGAIGPAHVLLGAAGEYAILAKSAVSDVPASAITGNLGLSPAAATYITGFSLTRSGDHWTSPQVVGRIVAADNDPPTPTDLTTAVANMEAAYTDAAGRPPPSVINLGAGTIGGMTLAPGLYTWGSSVLIPTDITIAGAANDTWIFQVSGDLILSAATRMTLSGGAQAKNIVWQVAGLVDFGTTSHAEGVVLSKTAIKLGTGASINGRLLAQTAVEIASSTVTAPAP
jgi:hypothetical protein